MCVSPASLKRQDFHLGKLDTSHLRKALGCLFYGEKFGDIQHIKLIIETAWFLFVGFVVSVSVDTFLNPAESCSGQKKTI